MRLIAGNLEATRGGETVFSGVSFELGSGEALVVTGPNGAGKTTMLRVVAGLLARSAGTLRMEGGPDQPVGALCHFLGVQNAMKNALSIADNLGFWQSFLGNPGLSPSAALTAVGLPGLEATPFAYLSTGQKRRAAIARLLVSHRPLWLLDEPTSGLDTKADLMFSGLLRQHVRDGGMAIAATHLPIGLDNAKRLALTCARNAEA